MQQLIDDHLLKVQDSLTDAAQAGNSSIFWKQWSTAVTRAFTYFFKLAGAANTKANNHGRAHISKQKNGVALDDSGNHKRKDTRQLATRHRSQIKQVNRLHQITLRVQRIDKWKVRDRYDHIDHTRTTCEAFCRTARISEDDISHEIAAFLEGTAVWDPSALLRLKVLEGKMRNQISKLDREQREKDRQHLADKLAPTRTSSRLSEGSLGTPLPSP